MEAENGKGDSFPGRGSEKATPSQLTRYYAVLMLSFRHGTGHIIAARRANFVSGARHPARGDYRHNGPSAPALFRERSRGAGESEEEVSLDVPLRPGNCQAESGRSEVPSGNPRPGGGKG